MGKENTISETIPDFKILHDGTWMHDGAPIKRAALAKLFSDRALVIDDHGDYWLKTPYEKYPVDVEDVPFVIVDYEFDAAMQSLSFRSNMDEMVELSADNPLILRKNKMHDIVLPYINMRDGLMARIGRSVYYHLIEAFGEVIELGEQSYPLGEMQS